MATRFALEGASVLVADIDGPAARRRAREIAHRGGRAVSFRADVGHPGAVRAMVRAAVRRFGRLDVLVNNAGIGSPHPFASRPVRSWDRVLMVNLRAPYLAAQAAAPHLASAGGAIVNIASTRALQSEADTEPYSASKGGVLALTHALAVTLSGRVRVNAISPGWIDTREWRDGGGDEPLTNEDHAQHPAGRVGRPEDIAEACCYLASPEAGFVTGQNLVVDGGMTVKMIYAE